MKTFFPIMTVLFLTVGVESLFAEPWTPSCAEAISHLRRAQEDVQAKQVEVRKAERGESLEVQKAEVCKPGGIIIAGRVAECVELSREVPIAIKELSVAKADRQPALDRFEEVLDDLIRRCGGGR